jgi:hypothetical protein
MRDAIGPVAISLVAGFILGLAAGWRVGRRGVRIERVTVGYQERFAVLHDGLLQDVQGLALSLQAVADQLPLEAPARRQLEQILDRTEGLLQEGQRQAKGRSI